MGLDRKDPVAIKARSHTASGKKVLFVCRSPVLASFVRYQLNQSLVEVVNFAALKSRPDALPDFDCLVVDEGQDMLDMESILAIDELFDGGISHGSWYFYGS